MRTHLKTILLFLAVAVLIAWYVASLDARQFAEMRARVAGADARLIAAAAALVCTTYLWRALRWRVLLRGVESPPGLNDLFAATTVGFASVFLIGRTGELVRPAFLTLRVPRVRAGVSFLTIAVERVCDMVMIAVLFAAALPFVSATDAAADERLALVRRAGVVVLACAGLGVVCLLLARRLAPRIIVYLDQRAAGGSGFSSRVVRTFANLLRQLTDALGVFGDRRSLLAAVGWSVLLWATAIVVHLLVLRAFGLSVGVAGTIFVIGCSLVGSLVPAPGGAAGTYHAATAGGLALLGTNAEPALAAAFVLHLVVWSPALPLGVYYFARSGANFGRLREIAKRRTPDDKLIDAGLLDDTAADHPGVRAAG